MNGIIAIPVYNEGKTLGDIIELMKADFSMDNMLFINDGSSDNSLEILKRSKVNFLHHTVNLGYEESLKTAMHYFLLTDMKYIVFFDSDGQHRIEDLKYIIEKYKTGEFDFIIGSRYKGKDKHRFSLRYFGTYFFSFISSIFTKIKITDSTCGLKLITRKYIPVTLQLPTENLHAELIAGLSSIGARIHETSITVNPRHTGDSMYNSWKAFIYPAKTLLCLIAGLIYLRNKKK